MRSGSRPQWWSAECLATNGGGEQQPKRDQERGWNEPKNQDKQMIQEDVILEKEAWEREVDKRDDVAKK